MTVRAMLLKVFAVTSHWVLCMRPPQEKFLSDFSTENS